MSNRKQRRRGFSLIELLIVIAIILIIITIAVPRYNRVQMYMRETAAIKAVQTIHQMETQYQSQFGRYASSLTELGPPASGNPSPAAADLIGTDLAQGMKQGYKFTVAAQPGGYTVNATPEVYGSSGSRSFFSDQTMVIRENYGAEPASASSKEMGVGEAGGAAAPAAPAKQ
jgi:prepilin-type N-terminal cleavage/methylation domain-containing protein